jgi:ribonuclease Z
MFHPTVGPRPRRSRSQPRAIWAALAVGALLAFAGGATAAGEPATGSADAMSNPGASWATEPIGTFTPGTPLDPDHMRITFLGTSFLPRIAQQANSVFVELGNGDSFVFDYGSGVSAKYGAMSIPPSRQTKVFITHLHGDHTSDLITLYCFGPSQDRKTPLHLYGPSGDTPDEGTTEWGATLKELMKWHVESFSFLPTGTVDEGDGYDIVTHELPYMETGVAYEADGVRITHFPAVHARNGSISYRLDWNGLSMVFGGDGLPTEYMIENAQGVDVLVHEMVVPNDVWAAKNSGLQPGDPGWERALSFAAAVQQSSHTLEPALGYILAQTQPRLGVATHFQVNPDTVPQAVENVQRWYGGPFAIATDLFVIDVSKDEIVLGQATVPEYAWYPDLRSWSASELAPAKYDSPTAQLNGELLSHVIDPDVYSNPPE